MSGQGIFIEIEEYMLKKLTGFAIFFILYLYNSSFSQGFKEELSIKAAAHRATHGSPLITYKGNIYIAYVTPNLKTVVGSNQNGWKWTTVHDNTANDLTHTTPSLGIDDLGYIHVVYDMHDDPWNYSISDSPEDISSFTKISSPDSRMLKGGLITYPFMVRDNNGKLFISYRDYVNKTGPGDITTRRTTNGMLAWYDSQNKKWISMGSGPNSAFAEDNSYGVYKPRIRFDRNNRLHIAWVWRWKVPYGADAMQPSYAWTDDKSSFFTALGGSYTLPITHTQPTKSNGGLVRDVSWTQYWVALNELRVAIDPQNRPHVLYRDSDKTYRKHSYDGSSWGDPVDWPSNRLIIGPDGTMFNLSNKKLEVSTDAGNTWSGFSYPESGDYEYIIYDDWYLRTTENLRFQAKRKSDHLLKIWTFSISNETDTSPPNAPKNIQVTSGDN